MYDMTRLAAERCLHEAGLSIRDVNVMEVHDCFSANEVCVCVCVWVCCVGLCVHIFVRLCVCVCFRLVSTLVGISVYITHVRSTLLILSNVD